ncbi:hypothetical protein E1162_18190 [Rhodobacteraceae bacterium RKSG542]|uniref:hypothetical protein n=1 Tax=Pseudovibrio flavus TaxID=2529854 RepID=UPI0012BB5A4A|nr:hypothetical protein [Pseudovibrio flavus]MTI19176.1 hypothetical protein [Pseudovibrio flavus]
MREQTGFGRDPLAFYERNLQMHARQQQKMLLKQHGLDMQAQCERLWQDGLLTVQGFLPTRQFTRLKEELTPAFFPSVEIEHGGIIASASIISAASIQQMPFLQALLFHEDLECLLKFMVGRLPVIRPSLVTRQASTSNSVPCGSQALSELFAPRWLAWLTLDEETIWYAPQSHQLNPKRIKEKLSNFQRRLHGSKPKYSLSSTPQEGIVLPPNTLVILDSFGRFGWPHPAKNEQLQDLFFIETNPFINRFSRNAFENKSKHLLDLLAHLTSKAPPSERPDTKTKANVLSNLPLTPTPS